MPDPDERSDTARKLAELYAQAEHERQSISAIVQSAFTLAERVRNLETYVQQREIRQAREEERDIVLNDKLTQIIADIRGIKKFGSAIQWTVLTSFILAFVAFVFRGGLT